MEINHLRKNQINAIQTSLDNNFHSGIHFHATGTGKSWIAMNIIHQYHLQYPTHNILWICEKKSILIEQFHSKNIKDRNFLSIIQHFHVLNFSQLKLHNWYHSVNVSKFWNKPILLIINRAFLVSNDKYKKINLPIHLIIHDECHTIVNDTTQEFYQHFIQSSQPPKCIGFSATPNLSIEPFNQILTSYSIYDAFMDDVIVPPKIKWFSSDQIITQNEIVYLIYNLLSKPSIIYKKIIVWCGMIELCKSMASLWKTYFYDYLICIDTSKQIDGYSNYDEFKDAENKAILFCACKHREGSDIKNLSCCVFLDKVENRSPKVFVQSIGRVLRLDNNRNKKYGLIIDVRAKNSYSICNNLNDYLHLPNGIFPWKYNYKILHCFDKLITINTLTMTKNNMNKQITCIQNPLKINYQISDITKLFIRTIPSSPEYINRIQFELQLLYKKNLLSYLIQAIEILHITKNMPHVTRGSCGSSLVCYLLGISHVDPIINNIKFARFLNEYRNNLPDIDLDFPHNLRDEVFLKIELQWPGKIARISNHVYYHDKSALRQAFRNAGIHKFIGKEEINYELRQLPRNTQRFIHSEKNRLENTFKCYSLHCGGIVYYPEGVPDDLLLNKNTSSIKQIKMNKYEIAKDKNFKIDILSSRGLSQLYEINKYKCINFEEFVYDKDTFDMLERGNNIGITLAESPLMRIAFMKIKPKNLHDLAVCLSIIRPAAKEARGLDGEEELSNYIIFDDDAIDIISKDFNIDEEKADYYRRAFAKGDKEGILEFKKNIEGLNKKRQREIMKRLCNLSKYGFCKAHAFSYAQLIWKLAYMKKHYPYEFWRATINNCESSYKKWVHYYEAKLAGVDILKRQLKKDDISIYACNRRKKMNEYSQIEQLRIYGYWEMKDELFFPNCYMYEKDNIIYFNGIIASSRIKQYKDLKIMMLFLGVEKQEYIQVNISNLEYYQTKNVGVRGNGVYVCNSDKEYKIVTCKSYEFY